MRRVLTLTMSVLLCGALVQAVDVWDAASEDDGGIGTDNGAIHGTEQIHDLGNNAGVADQDWYIFQNTARSSYEVLIDGTTGDMNLTGGDVARMSDSVTVVQNSVQLQGYSAVLRFQNATSTTSTQWIRVSGAACTTACTSTDQYRFRFYETTYSIPRFNNSGTQVTVLNVASMVPFGCSATFHFYSTGGTHLGQTTNTFSARELYVLNTSASFPATSGSIIVTHTCGYGGLTGKAVAVEPATGFTFDTPLIPRIL
jgi:hypothetical protein